MNFDLLILQVGFTGTGALNADSRAADNSAIFSFFVFATLDSKDLIRGGTKFSFRPADGRCKVTLVTVRLRPSSESFRPHGLAVSIGVNEPQRARFCPICQPECGRTDAPDPATYALPMGHAPRSIDHDALWTSAHAPSDSHR